MPEQATARPWSGETAIEARDLTRRFGTKSALDRVSVSVPRGQICAVLGPNGAGKSTLIRCALGLERPGSGSIRIFSHDAGTRHARRHTSAMLQDVDLPDALTGREHLSLYAAYHRNPLPVAELIEQVELGEFADVRYQRLSGGQRRRVQFALALVGRPALVFLDEPTTGLDAPARKAVWRNVRHLAEHGTTVVLTTHYLEEADALADRIVLLRGGRIVADDEPDAIRSRVGGALISCETALDAEALRALPAVRDVSSRGRLTEMISTDTPQTLAALLASDASPRDLTVRKPSLDEAFAALTATEAEIPQC